MTACSTVVVVDCLSMRSKSKLSLPCPNTAPITDWCDEVNAQRSINKVYKFYSLLSYQVSVWSFWALFPINCSMVAQFCCYYSTKGHQCRSLQTITTDGVHCSNNHTRNHWVCKWITLPLSLWFWWCDIQLHQYFVSSQEQLWINPGIPFWTRMKTQEVMRVITSVLFCSMRWRHGRSRGEYMYYKTFRMVFHSTYRIIVYETKTAYFLMAYLCIYWYFFCNLYLLPNLPRIPCNPWKLIIMFC